MREWMGYVEPVHERRLADPLARHTLPGLVPRRLARPARVDTGSEASVSLVNNCFVSDCYARMAQMARLTGHDDEAAAFEARREALNRTIHARFYDPATQTYATGSAARHDLPDAGGRHARFAPRRRGTTAFPIDARRDEGSYRRRTGRRTGHHSLGGQIAQPRIHLPDAQAARLPRATCI